MESKLITLQQNITYLSEAIDILNQTDLECPSGWSDGGKLGCYLAAKEASTMTQANAQAYCTSLDQRAHLVEIRTQEIQEFVEGLADLQSNKYWWLGGNDKVRKNFH